jgi:hypothetical protein
MITEEDFKKIENGNIILLINPYNEKNTNIGYVSDVVKNVNGETEEFGLRWSLFNPELALFRVSIISFKRSFINGFINRQQYKIIDEKELLALRLKYPNMGQRDDN